MNSADDQLPKPSHASASSDPEADTPVRLSPKPVRPAEDPVDQPVAPAPTLTAPTPVPPVAKPPAPDSPPAASLTPSSAVPATSAETPAEDTAISPTTGRHHPIPPASEPMQYRAIGLVRGQYTPSEEQFTRGEMVTEDGITVQAVLLGRVMSLVKKHLDLSVPHLWVVYPRTRDKDRQNDLHVQIVGVWEPENLSKKDEVEGESDEPEATQPDGEAAPAPVSPEELKDGYFSIRGEVLFHSEDADDIIVRIQQSPKKSSDEERNFKLNLKGKLTGKTVGYFWELDVCRQGSILVIQDGKMIGLVPPRKRKARAGGARPGGPGRFKKPWSGPNKGGPRNFRRNEASSSSGNPRPSAPPKPREMGSAPSKPIKRPKDS